MNRIESILTEMNIQYMEFHPYANIFPPFEEIDLNALAEDIKNHGQQETIKLLDGKIIDGRNRFKACIKAGVDPKFEELEINDPLKYVISLNLHRRHLNESQRAWIAANIADTQICTQYDAAKLLNVSLRSVNSAVAVKSKAIPEIFTAIQEGKLPVSTASQIANLDKDKQHEVIQMGKKDIVKTLKEEARRDPDGTLPECDVTVMFQKSELALIMGAMKCLGQKDRSDFIRGIVVSYCKEGLPPKKSEFPKGPKRFYTEKDMIPGKKGISRQEGDEAKYPEMRYHAIIV